MMPKPRILACLAAVLLLTGCASALQWDPDAQRTPGGDGTYTVEEGDTLYSIAFDHGLDYRKVAEWNDIGESYLIYPGQELVLREGAAPGRGEETGTPASGEGQAEPDPPAAQPAPSPQRRDLDWRWPLSGQVLKAFGEGSLENGLQLGASEGDPVHAAADGEVVYTGSGLIGYGRLIIIKHDDVYLSAYGHNREIQVDEGDQVTAGDRIASVGRGSGDRPMLHFEIRVEGEAVDPLQYLPDPG